MLERSIVIKRVTLVLAFGLLILTVSLTRAAIVYDAVAHCTSTADGKAEAAKYQGVWRFDSFIDRGKIVAKEDREKLTVKFEEDRFTARKDGAFTDGGTWKLGAAKKPMEITLVYTEGNATGITFYGIYRWDDDDLVACYGSERPTKFESDSKNNNRLVRLSKLKK